jgi:hypothetical protein
MKRTRVLMDKISGKQNIDKKYLQRPDTGKTNIVSQKMIKPIPSSEEEFVSTRVKKQLDRYIELILKNVAHVD